MAMSASFRRVLFRTLAVTLGLGAILAFWGLVRALGGAPLFDWVSVGLSISLIAATVVTAFIAELVHDTTRLRAFWLGSTFVLALYLSVAVAFWVRTGEIGVPSVSTSIFLFVLVMASGAASHFCVDRERSGLPFNGSQERNRER